MRPTLCSSTALLRITVLLVLHLLGSSALWPYPQALQPLNRLFQPAAQALSLHDAALEAAHEFQRQVQLGKRQEAASTASAATATAGNRTSTPITRETTVGMAVSGATSMTSSTVAEESIVESVKAQSGTAQRATSSAPSTFGSITASSSSIASTSSTTSSMTITVFVSGTGPSHNDLPKQGTDGNAAGSLNDDSRPTLAGILETFSTSPSGKHASATTSTVMIILAGASGGLRTLTSRIILWVATVTPSPGGPVLQSFGSVDNQPTAGLYLAGVLSFLFIGGTFF